MLTIQKPQPGEYAPYALDYIKLVPDDGRVLAHLQTDIQTVRQTIATIPEAWLARPFAEGEWTVKEILVHIMDTERVFSYRALRIGRGDTTDLPGFDQETYTPMSGANARSLDSIFDEYATVRAASLSLFNAFDEAAFTRMGTANKNPLSVRAALYIIAGHELYHLDSLRANYVGRPA